MSKHGERNTKALAGKAVAPAVLQHPPLPGHLVRLSDPEMKDRMEKLGQRIDNDPEFAKEMLRRIGILDSKGKLTKRYA